MADGKVIAVLNMKGGVGKTTISAHVFRVFYLSQSKRVLLIDLDPQFNLTQCVITQTNYDNLKKNGRTVLRSFEAPPNSNFFSVNTAVTVPPSVNEIGVALKATSDQKYFLNMVPGDF